MKAPSASATVWSPAFCLTTGFITGTAVLVLEILGTRLISPLYGNTIYVWSSLIVVTLLALAAGYAVGGWLADRPIVTRSLFTGIAAAGIWMLVMPFVTRPVLVAFAPVGPAGGALLSALVLFAAPLFLLGATGPQLIRLLTVDLSRVGRSAGAVYTVSTIGSVVGALLAGFVLIPRVGLQASLRGTAVILILTGAAGLLRARRRHAATAVALASLLAFIPSPGPATDGTTLFSAEGLYGHLTVEERGDERLLLIDGLLNSNFDVARGESTLDYIRVIEAVAAFRPEAKRALLIGLGGGGLAKTLESRHGLIVDAVEIDPTIARLARDYFDYRPKGDVFIGDGRRFVATTDRRYDVVILDAYSSDQVPGHLLTRDFFAELKTKMNPRGVVAINFVRRLERGRAVEAWEAVAKTVATQFKHLRLPSFLFPRTGDFTIGHVFIFASDAPLALDIETSDVPEPVRAGWARAFARELRLEPARETRIPILTDDHNPIDLMMAKVMLAFRMEILRAETGV